MTSTLLPKALPKASATKVLTAPALVTKALTLPVLSAEQVKVTNDLCQIQQNIDIKLAKDQFTFALSSENKHFISFLELTFSVNGQLATLFFDQPMTELLVKEWLPAQALLFLPETLRIATLQAAISPFLKGLSASVDIKLAQAHPPVITRHKNSKPIATSCVYHVYGLCQTSQGKGNLCLALASESYRQLLSGLETSPQQENIGSSLTHHCSLMLAQTSLTTQQLSKLQIHDVIMFDKSTYQTDKPMFNLIISESVSYLVEHKNQQLIIKKPVSNVMQEDNMKDSLISTDEIPVKLTFEAANLTLPFGELEQLSTGHVFDFGCDVEQPINIKANGQIIGTCTLVSVAGKLGAKVTDFHAPRQLNTHLTEQLAEQLANKKEHLPNETVASETMAAETVAEKTAAETKEVTASVDDNIESPTTAEQCYE